jgi:hypothetical protein
MRWRPISTRPWPNERRSPRRIGSGAAKVDGQSGSLSARQAKADKTGAGYNPADLRAAPSWADAQLHRHLRPSEPALRVPAASVPSALLVCAGAEGAGACSRFARDACRCRHGGSRSERSGLNPLVHQEWSVFGSNLPPRFQGGCRASARRVGLVVRACPPPVGLWPKPSPRAGRDGACPGPPASSRHSVCDQDPSRPCPRAAAWSRDVPVAITRFQRAPRRIRRLGSPQARAPALAI